MQDKSKKRLCVSVSNKRAEMISNNHIRPSGMIGAFRSIRWETGKKSLI